MASVPHAIDVNDLVRQYPKGPRAVDGIDLYVEEGEIYGFLGPNGAGKSTTVKMLVTLLPPSSGTAIVGGFDVSRQGPEVREIIGVALQEAALDPLLTGTEHMRLQGGMHGLSSSQADARGEVLMQRVGLSGAAGRRAGTYSGGMRRRLDLALALVHEPRILFLDEPTTGLDPQSRSALWDEVFRLAKEEGVTIFLTTQYLEEADVLAQRIGIIDNGRIVAEGTPEALKAEIGRPTVEVTPERKEDLTRVEGALARFGESVRGAPDAVAIRLFESRPPLAEIIRSLDSSGIPLANLVLHAPSLDDVFLAKTGRSLEERAEEPESPAAEEVEAERKVEEVVAKQPDVNLDMAVAGRSKIEKLPTGLLKDWMAERHRNEALAAVQAARKTTLVMTKGPLAGQEIDIDGQQIFGREGDIVISDPEISRQHAVIRIVDGSPVLDDLQSLNGTWVNGKRIELPTLLAPGDVVTLGTSTFEVRMERTGAGATMAPNRPV